jgi:PTS system nitrogen regulatory IIA component
MQLTDLLSADRVAIERAGATAGNFTKAHAVALLARLLASGTGLPPQSIEQVLAEREQLQSTGIGEGVAIPHGAMAQLEGQCAALLIVPDGVDFQAIDEHLKTLARVSRLLRNKAFRDRLVLAPSAGTAYDLIATEEGGDKR